MNDNQSRPLVPAIATASGSIGSPLQWLPEVDEVRDRVEEDRLLFDAGWRAALRANPPCAHVHLAVADSVAGMFPGWDGADAAYARSAVRVRNQLRNLEGEVA